MTLDSSRNDVVGSGLLVGTSSGTAGERVPGPSLRGRVTMQQVAAEAGVSISTVSKVINGRYGVSTETVDHVSQVIDRLGYEASLVARSLRNRRTNVVGVLVIDFEPFSTEVLKGVAKDRKSTRLNSSHAN